MALGKQVIDSLQEASASLRNALAYAARQERPIVCTQISKMINEIEHIGSFDGIMDKLEEIWEWNETPELKAFIKGQTIVKLAQPPARPK